MRSFADRDLPKLLELIYDADLDADRWQAFLDLLPSIFGGARGIMYMFDLEQSVPLWTLAFNTDPVLLKSYADYYWGINPYSVDSTSSLESSWW